jgi:hypothetical protein
MFDEFAPEEFLLGDEMPAFPLNLDEGEEDADPIDEEDEEEADDATDDAEDEEE